jgi:Zn-dependent protease
MIALGNLDVTAALTLFVVLLVSNTVHEAAHALAAKLGGDLTAYRGGQVSLNPLPHIDPVMTILLPAISLYTMGFLFGGAKPVGFKGKVVTEITRAEDFWVAEDYHQDYY